MMVRMMEPISAGKKPVMLNPGVNAATKDIEMAFTTKRNKPSVRRVSGNVRIIKIGRTIPFTSPNRIAAVAAATKPSTLKPGTK